MSFEEHKASELSLGHFKGLCFIRVAFLAAVVQFADQFLQLVRLVLQNTNIDCCVDIVHIVNYN
jgi:hypothetical protein